MQLSAIDGTVLDFLHSAHLLIELPPGVSVTSDGGFLATGSTPYVPEPSSLLMLGSAASFLSLLLRRSTSRGHS